MQPQRLRICLHMSTQRTSGKSIIGIATSRLVSKQQKKHCWVGHQVATSSASIVLMTLVLSLVVSMGYKEVYMLGIDLVQADHFFSVHPAYGAEHRMFSRVSHSSLNQTQELSVLPRNHSGRHLTEGRGFSKFVEGLFEGLRGRGVRGFNLSPLSKPIISTETVPYRRLDALLESIDTESS